MESIVTTDNIGQRLKLLRSHLNVTGQEFAEKAGVNLGIIRKLERGVKHSPSIEFPISINQAFGASITWLLTGKGDMFELSPELETENRELKSQIAEQENTIKSLLKAYSKLQGELKRVTQAQGVTDRSNQYLLNLPTSAPTRFTVSQ